nr:small subunit ribosomal protein S17 [uncultured archaeon]
MKKKGIGLEGAKAEKTCSDKHCPFHGKLTVRGRILTGVVTSDKMSKTVTVNWTRRLYVPKYERYEKRRSKVKAHNPECIAAKKGDAVRIAETKPLAKTKHFVVIEILGKQSKEQAVKEELLQESLVETVSEKQKPDMVEIDEKKKAKSDEE